MANKIVVTQDPMEPVPVEIIADSIKRVAEGFEKMDKSGLTRHALILLISASCGVNRTTVGSVLRGIGSLKSDYLTPAKQKGE